MHELSFCFLSVKALLFTNLLSLLPLLRNEQAWLLYYYVTLALRENILNVNGSFIKPWWILHHYVSIGTSSLLSPSPPLSLRLTHTHSLSPSASLFSHLPSVSLADALFCTAMSLTILTWPDTSESYKLFLQQFLYFSLLQGTAFLRFDNLPLLTSFL